MLNIFNIFAKQPWKEYEPIFQFIERNIDNSGMINDPFLSLPDESQNDDGGVKFAVGAKDGIIAYHAGGEAEKTEQVEKIISQFVRQINNPSKKNRIHLYNGLKNTDALPIVDQLMSGFQKTNIDFSKLYGEVRWLALNSAHRNVTKLAIAILGGLNTDDDDILLVLGKHEEFTLFSAVALINKKKDAQKKLLELARCVKGWGKIHVVERIHPVNEEIKRWLIAYGCENAIMDEYLAYTCATNGNLLSFLDVPQIDYDLFRGAGRIIQALINGGPAPDINNYEDGTTAIQKYIEHASCMKIELEDIVVLGTIEEYLNEKEDEEYRKLLNLGWADLSIKENVQKIRLILSDDKWREIIIRELKTQSEIKRFRVFNAARTVKLDIWDNVFNLLTNKPNDKSAYFELMRTGDASRVNILCQFAEDHLNLNSIIGVPEDKFFGYDDDSDCLDYILSSLERFEGVGGKLVSIGLQARSIRNRNMAIKTLEKWDTKFWPNDSAHRLKTLKEVEPNGDTLKRVNQLLAGLK